MAGAYTARRVAAALQDRGEPLTLRRRKGDGTWDEIAVSGKVFNPRLSSVELDGEVGSVQRVRISNAEIAASTLPNQAPTEKDQVVVAGQALTIDAVNTQKDSGVTLMHILEVSGIRG
jgi:hypothetical protein